MNQSNLIKKVGAILLSSVMTNSMVISPVFAAQKDESPTEKTETIYAVMESDGSLSSQIVSNWIHDEDGITNIKEKLNLTNVENVKTDEQPKVNGNEYIWNVEGNDVYYQGDSNEQVPVKIRLEYELDGKKIKPENIKNVKGHLKITVHFTNVSEKTIQTGGKKVKVHPFYVAGGVVNFDTSNATNVTCSSGKILSDASKNIVAFVSLPGLAQTFESADLQKVNDKLKISDDCVIEADVKKYTLGEMMFGISNEMDIDDFTDTLDVSSYTGSLTELFDGADQLLEGSKTLADGTKELQEKALPLTTSQENMDTLIAGALRLDEGANQLNTGVQKYLTGTSQINVGLTQLDNSMNKKDETYGINFLELSKSLADGSTTLKESVDGFVSTDQFKQLQKVLSASKSELESMSSSLSIAKETISGLESSLSPVKSSMEDLSSALTMLSSTATNVQTKLNNNANENNAIVESNNAIIAQYNQATENALAALDAAIQIAQSSEDENVQASAAALIAQRAYIAQVGSLQELGTVDVSKELAQLNAIVDGICTKVDDMEGTIAQAKAAIGNLEGVLESSQESVKTLEKYLSGAQNGMSSMSGSLESLQNGVHQLWVGSINLNKAINGYVDENEIEHVGISQAVKTLKEGTDTLVASNEALKDGANQLAEGTSQLASNKKKLQEMSDGLTTLGEALIALKDGAQELYEGEQTFETKGMSALKELADLAETDIETLKDIFNAEKELKPESYSGSPDGAQVKTRFIIRTKAIETK